MAPLLIVALSDLLCQCQLLIYGILFLLPVADLLFRIVAFHVFELVLHVIEQLVQLAIIG